MKENELKLSDKLAIERTNLANTRTFLAYFRSSVFFLGSGLSIIKINFFDDISYLGWGFIILAPLLFFMGLFRKISVSKSIKIMVSKAEN
jgi:putative membrane protein